MAMSWVIRQEEVKGDSAYSNNSRLWNEKHCLLCHQPIKNPLPVTHTQLAHTIAYTPSKVTL